MKYSLATNWDNNLLSQIVPLNLKYQEKIVEFFGSLSTSLFGHARQAGRIPDISRELAGEKIKKIKNANIQFNYLINSSTFPYLDTQQKIDEAKEYFHWIKKQNVDILTIGNEKTLAFVNKYFPEIPINLSVVLAIKTSAKAEILFKKNSNIKRITPHQSINRDKKKLFSIIKISHKYGIEVELLANEICVYNCPKMKDHYIFMSKTTQNKGGVNLRPIQWCQQINPKNKLAFLNACWIRPEDVALYENLGVDILKISGRNETTEYLTKTAEAYFERKYDGNALDLFYQSQWTKDQVSYYNNRKLNGFIEYLWENGLARAESVPEKYVDLVS